MFEICKLRPVKIGDSVDDGALVACQVGQPELLQAELNTRIPIHCAAVADIASPAIDMTPGTRIAKCWRYVNIATSVVGTGCRQGCVLILNTVNHIIVFTFISKPVVTR